MSSLAELRDAVETGAGIREDPFALLRSLADHVARDGGRRDVELVRSLVIQTREQRASFPVGMRGMVDALVRELGLFPYLEDDGTLTTRDLLTRETFRQTGLADRRIVFHAAQAAVFARLMAGDNLILSAPTSFGKSLLIDALLASGKFNNVLVVVPTLALLDETRRRLSSRQTGHKVITHPSQLPAARNVLVLTAERVLDFGKLPTLDLFVLDEFYKLSGLDERAQVLNQVFYEIRKLGVQHYLLGPNVEGLAPGVESAIRAEFVRSDDTTVALRLHDVDTSGGRPEALVALCRRLTEPTLVYCQSPDSAHKTAGELVAAGLGEPVPSLASAGDWVAENYHPDWIVGIALRRGIGIHHGQLPRALAQFMVNAFEDGRIDLLICTGSLIEGVNTQAQNVVLYDRMRPGNKKMDAFTFRNICGRCGRMLRHFSGDVWLMHPPPPDELPTVDIPVLSQEEDVPTSLLQQIDEDDLSDRSKKRLEPLHNQQDLSEATLKANVGVDVDKQLALARAVRASPRGYHPLLSFTATPEHHQLKAVCKLIWTHLGSQGLHGDYVRSWDQLARQLSMFARSGSPRALVIDATAGMQPGNALDKKIAGVCQFVRSVASYAFPMRLRALNRIQREVFTEAGMQPGEYTSYISRVEGLFMKAPLLALDEYGVPPELASKLAHRLKPDGDLDAVLARLDGLDAGALGLTAFETEMVRYAQSGL
jgi:hypothetical protein